LVHFPQKIQGEGTDQRNQATMTPPYIVFQINLSQFFYLTF
jgi:hypothetical protein